MKRLYLLRHAQALPSSPDGDKGRKLSPKGNEDAAALGRMMVKAQYNPGTILCSPAIRTQETQQQLCRSFKDLPLFLLESLYNAPAETLLNALHALDDAVDSALLVAHNPGIHGLVALLTSDESGQSLAGRLMQGYAPATLSVLDCPVERWEDLAPYNNLLIDLQEPLDYNAPASPARWT